MRSSSAPASADEGGQMQATSCALGAVSSSGPDGSPDGGCVSRILYGDGDDHQQKVPPGKPTGRDWSRVALLKISNYKNRIEHGTGQRLRGSNRARRKGHCQ